MKQTLQNLLAEGKTLKVITERLPMLICTLWLELVRDAPQYVQFQQFLGKVQEDLSGL